MVDGKWIRDIGKWIMVYDNVCWMVIVADGLWWMMDRGRRLIDDI